MTAKKKLVDTGKLDAGFGLHLYPAMRKYVDKESKRQHISKNEFVRNILEKHMLHED